MPFAEPLGSAKRRLKNIGCTNGQSHASISCS